MGFFSKIKEGLRKTKDSMVKKMQRVVNSFTRIDEELFEQLEETMQKIMDQYAGGIATDYRYNESRLALAKEKITSLQKLVDGLAAEDMDDLLRIYEVKERLVVCQVVIAHLLARKETRWHSFAENADYPEKNADWEKYVNSRMKDGEIEIIFRELVTGGKHYEHTNYTK